MATNVLSDFRPPELWATQLCGSGEAHGLPRFVRAAAGEESMWRITLMLRQTCISLGRSTFYVLLDWTCLYFVFFSSILLRTSMSVFMKNVICSLLVTYLFDFGIKVIFF